MSMSHPDELESVMLEADQDHMEQRTSGSDHLHLRMNSSEDISSLSPDPMHSARVSPDRITDKIRSYINPTAGAETPEQSQHGTSPSPNASPQQLSASVMQQSPAVSTPASYNLPLPPPHDNHSSIQDMLPLPPPHHAPHDKRLDSLPPAAATALPTSFPMLDSLQCFSGNPLERSSDVTSKFDPALSSPTSEVSLIVVSGRFVCIRPSPSSSSSSSPAGSLHELQALLLGIMDAQFDFNSEQISFTWIDESGTSKDDEDHVVKQPMPNASGSLQDEAADVLTDLPGSIAHTLPLYLLGRDSEERWTFALDVSSCEEGFTRWLKVSCGLEVTMMEMRKLMPMLSREACAIAGQAISLCQW